MAATFKGTRVFFVNEHFPTCSRWSFVINIRFAARTLTICGKVESFSVSLFGNENSLLGLPDSELTDLQDGYKGFGVCLFFGPHPLVFGTSSDKVLVGHSWRCPWGSLEGPVCWEATPGLLHISTCLTLLRYLLVPLGFTLKLYHTGPEGY